MKGYLVLGGTSLLILSLYYLTLEGFPFMTVILVALTSHVATRTHLHLSKGTIEKVEDKVKLPAAYQQGQYKRPVKRGGRGGGGR
eukprot:CAMPEP_0119142010 /NCGR_PEP_ID=MMETSP1310-20130426/31969_1 /TAXON_ID=464262 /ORGANISM="Genus nov. species nov., Strain RCC2339" /LENGTH=84 /DNA_ID=CAMNT_0007133515 /DNA_START=44 /DNA_END=295 /DNA_ORIENTATION=-